MPHLLSKISVRTPSPTGCGDICLRLSSSPFQNKFARDTGLNFYCYGKSNTVGFRFWSPRLCKDDSRGSNWDDSHDRQSSWLNSCHSELSHHFTPPPPKTHISLQHRMFLEKPHSNVPHVAKFISSGSSLVRQGSIGEKRLLQLKGRESHQNELRVQIYAQKVAEEFNKYSLPLFYCHFFNFDDFLFDCVQGCSWVLSCEICGGICDTAHWSSRSTILPLWTIS